MMRIVIVGLSAATHPSGICRTIASLVRGLNEFTPGVEIALVVGQWQRRYFEDSFGLRLANSQIFEVDILNHSIRRNRWYLFEFPKLARQLRANIVQLSFPAPVVRRLFPCPIVTTLHDLYPYDFPANFGYPHVLFNRGALRRAMEASDRIVCVSKVTLASLRRHFPGTTAGKAIHVQNAIFSPEVERAQHVLVPPPFFLTVAQHRRNKNLDLLVRSFHLYRSYADSDPSLRLVIVGMPGPETDHLHELLHRLELRESVLFLSNIRDSELTALYRECELFVTLSQIEGFNLPLGEAVANGARVLASDIATHREIAGDTCEYVHLDESDAVHIAEALRRVSHRLRTPMRNPRPVSETAREYLEVYKAALQEDPVNLNIRAAELSVSKHQ